MFTPNLSAHINGENITFIDFSESSHHPTECLIVFNPELYQIHLEELNTLEDDLISRYDVFSEIHKDPLLLENGVIHFTPVYPSDMSDTVKIILVQVTKPYVRNLILNHCIRIL
ncbi:MAG: hypothetical protein Q4F60_00615 [Candidatus Saccharibacteria bacterium]|nr:hypothetical protein [Candidatus Saccharibacteria bacterium]